MNIGNYLNRYSEDLRLKNYSENTIKNYVTQVGLFLNYFDKKVTKPSEIKEQWIKDWLLQAKSINGRKHRISAVKLFYSLTGKQPLKFKYIEYPKSEKKLPQVIDTDYILESISKISNRSTSRTRATSSPLISSTLPSRISCRLSTPVSLTRSWAN